MAYSLLTLNGDRNANVFLIMIEDDWGSKSVLSMMSLCTYLVSSSDNKGNFNLQIHGNRNLRCNGCYVLENFEEHPINLSLFFTTTKLLGDRRKGSRHLDQIN